MNNKNQLHNRELDRRLHLQGFDFITNARVARRGGWVAVVVNTSRGYSAKRLQVNCASGPNSLEVVWVLVSPPSPVLNTKHFICISIYSPPRSKLNEKMIEHLQFNINKLTAQYPEAAILIGGDINNLPIRDICNSFPDMVNLVTDPTHGSCHCI